MKKINLLFWSLLLAGLLCLCKGIQAQVVHAGLWTGLVDGNGVKAMVGRDSFLYIDTDYGTAFVNTNTQELRFLHESGNSDLPAHLNLAISDVDKNGALWTLVSQKLARVTPDGDMVYVGPSPAHQVLVLRIDRQNQVWAGMATEQVNNPATTACLARFDGADWQTVDFAQTRMNIRDIVFDAQNRPWVTAASAYNSTGIFRYNGSGFEKIPGSPNLFKIALSDDGRIAACGNHAGGTVLKYYKDGVWTAYGTLNTNLPPDFSFPVFTPDNTLWVCNKSTGRVYALNDSGLNLKQSEPTNYRSGENNDYVEGFCIDPSGRIWIGKSIGLFRAPDPETDHWDFVQTGYDLFPGRPKSMASNGDTIWLNNETGLTRLVNLVPEPAGITVESGAVLYYDPLRHGLWVGSTGKLDFYQGAVHTQIDITAHLNLNFNTRIYDLAGDKAGNLWVFTQPGILRYGLDGSWKSFDIGEEFPFTSEVKCSFWCVKDQVTYVKVFGSYPVQPPIVKTAVYKIEGDVVTDLQLPNDVLTQTGSFYAFSDEEIWFNGGTNIQRLKNGQRTIFPESEIGGYLNNQQIRGVGDSTALVPSNFGLYVYQNDTWFHPTIPSGIISNTSALPWLLEADGRMLFGAEPLLILDNLQSLLNQFSTNSVAPDKINLNADVFPNPTSGILNLERVRTAFGESTSARLIGADGRVYRTFYPPMPVETDLSMLPKGVYFLQLIAEEGRHSAVFKVLRQ